jgi:hypothetical protein
MGGGILGLVLQGVSAFTNYDAKVKEGGQLARMEESDAKAKAKGIRRLAREARGAATAGFASSGVDVSSGSAALVDEQIVRDSEMDVMNALLTGKRRAKYARDSGKAAGDAYALQTAGNIYSNWLTARNQGGGSSGGGGGGGTYSPDGTFFAS